MGSSQSKPLSIGRYAVYGEIAAGGMATVHLGRMTGHVGFSRTVAVKRLHAQFAKDPDFVGMFVDEARLAGRVRHPNVVPILDVISSDDELCIVMEYVPGISLSQMTRAAAAQKTKIPLRIIASIMVGVLEGLHAAHEAVGEIGEPLGIVHRDVSPQNIQVGVDGLARVLDFGVAKAVGRQQTTQEGQIKGKIAYMAPEQVRGLLVDRRTDVYAAAAILWEALTGKRLFEADSQVALLSRVLHETIPRPSELMQGVPPDVESIVMRGLERDPTMRFQSAEEMAVALENAVRIASPREVGRLVESLGGTALRERSAMVADVESTGSHMNLAVAGDVAKVDATMRDSIDVEMDLGPAPVQETQSAFHSAVASSPSKGSRRLWVGVAAVALFAGSGLGIGAWFGLGRGRLATTPVPTNLAQEPMVAVSATEAVRSTTSASAAAASIARPSLSVSASASVADTSPIASSVPTPVNTVRTTAPVRTTKDPKPDVPVVTDFGGRE